MRGIYTLEQTRNKRVEFFGDDQVGPKVDVFFLGNLYLKGKPYTDPSEAVDKQYVDERFANIDDEVLKGKVIPDKLYPAFNADLINAVNQNNFGLKSVVKGNRFHKPIFDDNGRIIGGSIGGYNAQMDDIESIDYETIKFPDNITSDTMMTGFNKSLYLNKVSENVINKPLRLNSYKQEGDTIIPEVEVKAIQSNYFNGTINGKMEVGTAPGGKVEREWEEYSDLGGQPWWDARGMSEVDISAMPNRGLKGKLLTSYNFTSNNFYIYKRKYVRMDGTYRQYATITNTAFSGEGKHNVNPPPGYNCKITDGSQYYIFNGRLCLYMNNSSSGYWTTCDLKSDGLPVGNWDTPVATPLGIPMMREGYFYVFGVQGKSSSAMYRLDRNGRLGQRTNLDSETIFPSKAFNGKAANYTNVRLRAVGKYVYAFLDTREYGVDTAAYSTCKRLLLPDETPESGWIDYNLGGTINGNKNSIPILTTNYLYIFTFRGSGGQGESFFKFSLDADSDIKLIKSWRTGLWGRGSKQDRYYVALGKDGLLSFSNWHNEGEQNTGSAKNRGITGNIPDFVAETTYN